MTIYRYNCKDRTVLELDHDELALIAYLLEMNHHKVKGKMKEPLSSTLHEKIKEFIRDKKSFSQSQ